MVGKSPWDALDYDVSLLVFQLLVSKTDRLTLTRVCKSSQAFVEPLLYSNIEWIWLEHEIPPIVAFLRTILCRPRLASYVRKLNLMGRPLNHRHTQSALPITVPIIDWDLNDAVEAIKELDVPYSNQWIQKLCRGSMDAFVALMLSRLHNLQCLSLGPNFTRETKILGLVFESALCKKDVPLLPRFEYLQEVIHQDGELNYHDTSRRAIDRQLRERNKMRLHGKKTADRLPYFYLPHLCRLELGLDNPITLTWPMNIPPDLSTVRTLDLTLVRERHLSKLFSLTTGLKTLRWELVYSLQSHHESNKSLIELDQIGVALECICNTLEELEISVKCRLGDFEEFPNFRFKGSMQALGKLHQLKSLQIPLEFLAGSFTPVNSQIEDTVPYHIKSLVITFELHVHRQNKWNSTSVCELIASWLGNEAPKPNLGLIGILLGCAGASWSLHIRESFVTLCSSYGILATVTSESS
jgi:hypothetical protein